MVNNYSPSQVIEFSRCNRKWYFNKILRYPQRESKSTALGTHIHTQFKNYFETKAEVEHQAARKSLDHLPAPGPDVIPELWMVIEPMPGVNYRGQCDLLDKRNPKHVVIYDHKTMKTFEYAKSGRELAFDVQVISYGYMAAHLHAPEAEEMTFVHNQIPTTGAEPPRKVEASLYTFEVKNRFVNRVLPVLQEMEVARQRSGVGDLTPNYDACNDFGGCPYKTQCQTVDRGGVVLAYGPEKEKPMDLSENVPLETHKEPGKADVASLIKSFRGQGNTIENLYVDCRPMGLNQPEHMADIMSEITSQVERDAGVPDWRMIKFGEGAGRIAAALRAATLPADIFLDTSLPTGRIALEVLLPLAANVVMATR